MLNYNEMLTISHQLMSVCVMCAVFYVKSDNRRFRV